jgi:hypothetical protein
LVQGQRLWRIKLSPGFLIRKAWLPKRLTEYLDLGARRLLRKQSLAVQMVVLLVDHNQEQLYLQVAILQLQIRRGQHNQERPFLVDPQGQGLR